MGCRSSTLERIKSNASVTLTAESYWDIDGSDAESPIVFICDQNGIILDVNQNVQKYLYFKRESLIGEFVGIIMTPHMNMLHREMFLRHYKYANKFVRNALDTKLSSKTIDRPLIIFDVNRKPVFVNLSLVSKPANEYVPREGCLPLPKESEYFFSLNAWVKRSQDESIYMYTDSMESLEKRSKGFTLSKNNIVVICIDFMQSTELLLAKGPVNMAFLNKRFYDDIVHVITHYFYPYISIHEIVGDSFVLVLNADWTYNLERYCATLAINFVNRLYYRTHEYVDMRVGVSYGKVIYGFIGPSLRLFGNPMHVASRLEGQCEIGRAVVNADFHAKLCQELTSMNRGCDLLSTIESISSKEYIHLKGYGEQECVRLVLSSEKEDLVTIED